MKRIIILCITMLFVTLAAAFAGASQAHASGCVILQPPPGQSGGSQCNQPGDGHGSKPQPKPAPTHSSQPPRHVSKPAAQPTHRSAPIYHPVHHAPVYHAPKPVSTPVYNAPVKHTPKKVTVKRHSVAPKPKPSLGIGPAIRTSLAPRATATPTSIPSVTVTHSNAPKLTVNPKRVHQVHHITRLQVLILVGLGLIAALALLIFANRRWTRNGRK